MNDPKPDTCSDKNIKDCIRENNSFSVVAGAGSGKTTSLIKTLNYVRFCHGNTLRKKGQHVVCITFTNRAVEVILDRINSDELFLVSTLHSFLWGEIKTFQKEIGLMLKEYIIPLRIKEKSCKDNGGQSKAAIAARTRIAELKQILEWIETIGQFKYNDSSSRNYEKGQLDHDDVIDLASCMIDNLSAFRKIIGQKYPYIFVDEAQDTFPVIVKALNSLASQNKLPVVGYFGDPVQQIYDDRSEDFSESEKLIKITKRENYRCSIEVIKLLNSFRTDIQQIPAKNNNRGSVRILLVQSEEGKGHRKTYNEEQIDNALKKFDIAINKLGWDDDMEVKRLFLSRQMIARRLGFINLQELFTGQYASRSAQDDYESGKHFLLKPFLYTLIPIVQAFEKDNHQKTFQILKNTSPLLHPKGENSFRKIKEVIDITNKAMMALVEAWGEKSLKEILLLSEKLKLISVSDRLSEQLQRTVRTEIYNEQEHEKEKGDWLADEFFGMKTTELGSYFKFINEETPFSTQHGVKGEEYEKVLVFYDDTESNWNRFNFARLLTPESSGKKTTEGQRNRSYKLAYVSFSRAKMDLAIILFTLDPNKAKKELMAQGYFSDSQIDIL